VFESSCGNQIHIVASADLTRESPQQAYKKVAGGDQAHREKNWLRDTKRRHWRKASKEAEAGGGVRRTSEAEVSAKCSAQAKGIHCRPEDIFQGRAFRSAGILKPGIEPFDLYRAACVRWNPSPYMYFFLRFGGASGQRDRECTWASGVVAGNCWCGSVDASWKYRPICGDESREGRERSGRRGRLEKENARRTRKERGRAM